MQCFVRWHSYRISNCLKMFVSTIVYYVKHHSINIGSTYRKIYLGKIDEIMFLLKISRVCLLSYFHLTVIEHYLLFFFFLLKTSKTDLENKQILDSCSCKDRQMRDASENN